MLNWRSFIRTFCYSALGVAGALYLFILLVDPYDNVPFSLPLEREPISTNQRFAYPSLARKPGFDSAIIGTSTARLLKPERLNDLTGDSWVNLAMNSATAYEQMEMLKLFLNNHPDARHVVIGIDDAWCNPSPVIQKFTFRPFPPWLYDDSPWNDMLYLFNDKSLENAIRLVEYWLGKRMAKYDRTGYRDFTLDFGEYEDEAVNNRLYPKGHHPIKALDFDPMLLEERDALVSPQTFVSHSLLESVLSDIEKSTNVILLFSPMHGHYLKRGMSNYSHCKYSLMTKNIGLKNVGLIDRMKIDELTSNDKNYWDPLHFTDAVAQILEREIASTK